MSCIAEFAKGSNFVFHSFNITYKHKTTLLYYIKNGNKFIQGNEIACPIPIS
jgi:hypothetical protein